LGLSLIAIASFLSSFGAMVELIGKQKKEYIAKKKQILGKWFREKALFLIGYLFKIIILLSHLLCLTV
jgi:hypothetical protein